MKLSPVAWGLAALVLFGGTVARAQSLSDMAKKEEERRKAQKGPAKVFTNDDLKRFAPVPPPADASQAGATPAPVPAPGDQPPGDQAKPAGDPAKPGEQAQPGAEQAKPAAPDGQKDEAYWKGLMTAARTKLERDQSHFDALQSQINALTNDFYARDDPAQRALIWTQRTKAIEEHERLKAEIADGTKTIAKIKDDARRQGIPPGWLR